MFKMISAFLPLLALIACDNSSQVEKGASVQGLSASIICSGHTVAGIEGTANCSAAAGASVSETEGSYVVASRSDDASLPKVNDSKSHDVTFKFGTDRYEVGIHRIIVGSAVIEKGVEENFKVKEAEKQGKYIVYFDVSVKNINGLSEKILLIQQFKLEDESGNSYSPKLPNDYIQGEIHHGKQGRGGISFWVYKGNIPKRLIYDTGYVLVNTDQTIFATGELDEFKDFFK